ncbi:MAG TPA: AraC family transcriptional regulator [Ottowia sp.]|nr:AraC family transcriptional regulator [Ottowia sp.]HNL41629.1 AraC family transcriptional regulator [Ottowia sp.]HNN32847.1 AraC family transcriptional regulator [Ottowia sp.]HNO41230.1 AraC family transcriptional regulator [Ottowia sp.]HOZ95174.1 AraC family transcriptional regulator [Ottowia sp.]
MTDTPPPCVLERWSSAEVDAAIRLDYWRDVAHNWVEVQPLSSGDRLNASWSLLRGESSFFGTKRSTAYEMRTHARHVPPGEDMVVLSLLEVGEMRLNAAPGEHQRVTAGMLGMYAPRQDACYRWGDGARQTYLALPRSVVFDALGSEPRNLLLAPQRCALAPMLTSQLVHLGRLARQPGHVGADEYASLLAATRALALLTLRNLGRQGDAGDLPDVTESLHAGRRAAALRFMESHAHRHDLDAGAIARGAGCSRTRLYEAFAEQDRSVMDTLREIRLQRARTLIERTVRLHVGLVAWRCGFADQSGFSKLFKARFGITPSEWHRWAQGRRGG